MSCPSIGWLCTRCSQIRRHDDREGLADAHRVFSRTLRPGVPSVRVQPETMVRLLPAVYALEWAGQRELLAGVVTSGCCPECGASESTQEHATGCGIRELIAQGRIAQLQVDLFEVA